MYFLYISLCPLFLYVYLHRKKYYLKDKAALSFPLITKFILFISIQSQNCNAIILL